MNKPKIHKVTDSLYHVTFNDVTIADMQKSYDGKGFFINFYADWCSDWPVEWLSMIVNKTKKLNKELR